VGEGEKKQKDLMQFGKLHYNHGVNVGIAKKQGLKLFSEKGRGKREEGVQFGKLHYRDFKKTWNENKKAECEEHGAKRCKSGFSKARIEIYISFVYRSYIDRLRGLSQKTRFET